MDTLYTFWDNTTHYKAESVHSLGLMNSATKLLNPKPKRFRVSFVPRLLAVRHVHSFPTFSGFKLPKDASGLGRSPRASAPNRKRLKIRNHKMMMEPRPKAQ